MHMNARQFVAQALSRLPLAERPRRVLEIGGRNVNGTIRDLFADAEVYICSDVAPGPGVDVVADGAAVDPQTRVDCVVCCEVLEHAPNARDVVAHAADLLASGGVLIVTAASERRAPHSGTDGLQVREGEHYAGITRPELTRWLAPFQVVAVQEAPETGDIYAVARRFARAVTP